jgi:hypothetical protein
VFAGSFSLEAAETVCVDERLEVLRLLSAGVDKSLVLRDSQAGQARMASGDFESAVSAFQRALALGDLNEEACRNLMSALAKQGQTSAAARTYRRRAERSSASWTQCLNRLRRGCTKHSSRARDRTIVSC